MSRRWSLSVGAVLAIAAMAGARAAELGVNSPARVKAFASMPDWHGIWELDGIPATLQPQSQEARPAASVGNPTGGLRTLGAGGRMRLRDYPPYNAEWEAKYQQLLSVDYQTIAGKNTNTRYCAAGIPRVLASPFMMEVIITPEKTWMLWTQREIRHIYTDGRGFPPEDQVVRGLWGDSVGRWEGGTLVVETRNVIPGQWLDPTAATLSDRFVLHERWSMPGADSLQNEITIEDPVAFEPGKKWQFTRKYKRVKDFDRMIDDICGENERNPIEGDQIKTIVK